MIFTVPSLNFVFPSSIDEMHVAMLRKENENRNECCCFDDVLNSLFEKYVIVSKLSRTQNCALSVLVSHGTRSVAVLHAQLHGENPVKGFSHLIACGISFCACE